MTDEGSASAVSGWDNRAKALPAAEVEKLLLLRRRSCHRRRRRRGAAWSGTTAKLGERKGGAEGQQRR